MRYLLILAALSACATPPDPDAPRPEQLRVFRHTCDQWGVKSVTIGATEAGVSTLKWDNELICGKPA